MDNIKIIDKSDLLHKKVIVRVDFNVPVENCVVKDVSRIKTALHTINFLREAGAKIILMTHFGSPNGVVVPELSLKYVLDEVSKVYRSRIIFIDDCLREDIVSKIDSANPGDIILLENLRFYAEEEKCNIEFAKKLSSFGDFFINEAFSVSHRNHASIVGIPKFLPHAFGFAFKQEGLIIDGFFKKSATPRMSIIGGSKLSTKVKTLKNLVNKVDKLALGGGIAGAFLSYLGNSTLKIFDPEEYRDDVNYIIKQAHETGCELIMPTDFSALINEGEDLEHAIISDKNSNASVFDIGPHSVQLFCKHIRESASILWNGPVGLFEKAPFDYGTRAIAKEIATRTFNGLNSIVGGGDTVYALNKFGVYNDISYVSTSGGAFLTYIEGGIFPGIQAMKEAFCLIE